MAWHVFAIRLVIALFFGALIGAERQWRQRMAGLRTNALVAAGAAMLIMMGGLIAGDGSQGRVAAHGRTGDYSVKEGLPTKHAETAWRQAAGRRERHAAC